MAASCGAVWFADSTYWVKPIDDDVNQTLLAAEVDLESGSLEHRRRGEPAIARLGDSWAARSGSVSRAFAAPRPLYRLNNAIVRFVSYIAICQGA